MPLHYDGMRGVAWPHWRDQSRPTYVRIAFFNREELPPEWQANCLYGIYVLADCAGYLCTLDDRDVQELRRILYDEAREPGTSRKRLTGESYEELRVAQQRRLEDQRRQPTKSSQGPQNSEPAADLSDLLGE